MYLSHCTCFCFAGKQVWVNWVSRITQVRKPTVANQNMKLLVFCTCWRVEDVTNTRMKQIVDVGNQ